MKYFLQNICEFEIVESVVRIALESNPNKYF